MTDQQPKPEPTGVKLTDPSYTRSKAELIADIRVNPTFEELLAAMVRPLTIRHRKPERKQSQSLDYTLDATPINLS